MLKIKHGILLLVALGIASCGTLVVAQDNEAPPKADFDVQQQIDSFDKIWTTIKEMHWDPELGGVDWDGARTELRPQVEKATNIDEARAAMEELIARLELSHFQIIPGDSYDAMDSLKKEGGVGTAGITIRLIDDQLIVTHVRPESPAAKAGVVNGWIVKQVGDAKAEELLEMATSASEHSPMRLDTTVGLMMSPSGKVGDTKTVAFLNEKDEEVELDIELMQTPGNEAVFGNLPPFIVEYQSKLLDDEIGYIAFNAFFDGPFVMKEYTKSIKEFRDKKGLIIDMRGNRGGMLIMTMGMSGWFVEERKALGEMKMRAAPLKISLNPRKPRFDKPVAILIDECSISAAEILAGGLKDLGVARVFGAANSAGLVLPSTAIKLPNGDGLQFAIADYKSASGTVLEGQGVEPDQFVEQNRESFFNNQDPVLNSAKAWIVDQSEN